MTISEVVYRFVVLVLLCLIYSAPLMDIYFGEPPNIGRALLFGFLITSIGGGALLRWRRSIADD